MTSPGAGDVAEAFRALGVECMRVPDAKRRGLPDVYLPGFGAYATPVDSKSADLTTIERVFEAVASLGAVPTVEAVCLGCHIRADCYDGDRRLLAVDGQGHMDEVSWSASERRMLWRPAELVRCPADGRWKLAVDMCMRGFPDMSARCPDGGGVPAGAGLFETALNEKPAETRSEIWPRLR